MHPEIKMRNTMFQNRMMKLREPVGKTFSIVFTGDVCPKSPESRERTIHNAEELAAEIRPFFASAALKLMQWEAALTEADTPIDKSGPNLKCPPECLNFGRALGIDVMLLANNHVGDFGPDAVLETVSHVENAGFLHAGAGKNLEDAGKTLFLERNGFRIAIVNFAENEFGTAGPDKPGVAPMHPFANIRQIREAKKNADIVIAAIHGGHEYYAYPSPRMVELYREYAAAGADIVWGCHTHCCAGCEIFGNVPIVYSPGNFYFPYPGPRPGCWHTGYLSKFFCDEKGVYALELLPYKFDANAVTPLNPEDEKLFFEYYEKISAPIRHPDLLQRCFEAWCTRSGIGYLSCLNREKVENWPPDWTRQEIVRSWLPCRNLFTCEAHNDMLKQTLRLVEEHRIGEAGKLLPEILALQNPPWM